MSQRAVDISVNGPSRDPATGEFLTREQLEEKYKWRDGIEEKFRKYKRRGESAVNGGLEILNNGSTTQCVWATTDFFTGVFWLVSAAFCGGDAGPFGNCSGKYGCLAGVVGLIGAILGMLATGFMTGEPWDVMYWPFAASKAVYAAVGFLFVFNVLLDKENYSVLSVDWGYLFVGLASLASGAGSLASFATTRWSHARPWPAAGAAPEPAPPGVQLAHWREQPPHGGPSASSWHAGAQPSASCAGGPLQGAPQPSASCASGSWHAGGCATAVPLACAGGGSWPAGGSWGQPAPGGACGGFAAGGQPGCGPSWAASPW